MRKYKDEILFSPSDLVSFLGCRYRTFLDRKNLDDPMEKSAVDESARLAQDKGIEHEQAYLDLLKQWGRSVVELEGSPDVAQAAAETIEAMGTGADVIYQAVFHRPPWHGLSDFLEKLDSPDGPYEVMDTKLSKTATPKHVVQITQYSGFLEDLQDRPPERMHLVLGDGRRQSFRPSDFSKYVTHAVKRFEEFVTDPPQDIYPEPCSACDLCHWKDRCSEKWEADDHLSLVANIRRSQREKLNAAGVTTVEQLADLSDGTRIPKLASESLDRLRAQARLQVEKRLTDQDRYELLDAGEGRGFARMPRPDDGDLFFDMEGDPYYPDGLEYLFGFHHVDDGEEKFTPFWAHDHEEERTAFERVMDFLTERITAHPNAHICHYNVYEEAALKRLASSHGTREEALDNLLRAGKLVDLYKVVREGIMVSEPRYSLKNLETFYMDKRQGDVKTAAESIVVYEKWRKTKDQKLLDEIAEYNEIDCVSTRLLRDWLLSIRPEGAAWKEPGDPASDEKIAEREEKARELERRVAALEGLAPEAPHAPLVGHLLGFHRREDKPVWWALFDRQGRDVEDLVEDADCLGGLVLDGSIPPFKEKRSTVYTYKAPRQETKLKTGDRPLRAMDGKSTGSIFALEENNTRVQIKTTQDDMPPAMSLIPTGPIDSGVLEGAIQRYADAIVDGEDAAPAVTALLKREPPRIEGHKDGDPIVGDDDDIIDGTSTALKALQDSYLLVQGPPGAGKTYLSSRVIVSLLRDGKKVGVSSNSHKAIHNLLAAVEEAALEAGVPLRGMKKASGGRPDTFFKGQNITDVAKSGRPDPSYNLLAGTAWFFAREDMKESVDYLFVDEAGQVSLANIVAIGMAARNLVLVGDQMQLAQPIQGAHPGDSGLSALEYLLEGKATVPADRGVFLGTTWRMGPKLCKFISDAVYDGRLHPEPENEKQRLVLGDGHHPAITEEGISFVPVEHSGCARTSDEEADVIREIYTDLMKQRYVNRKGETHPMTPEDVLVVSPYNAQVNKLTEVLPGGARVGTVDKFQGQEAQVVIVSMATSGAEEMPRNIEFLYSKNRLNVAISRARTLAIVVASPGLLEVPCGTVKQMELVNTLCWVAEG